MPSTVVHLAVGALVAAALLGDEFDRRALTVVLVAAAVPDFDTFFGFVLTGAHRSLLHTLLLPLLFGGALLYDTRLAGRSRLRDRFGGRGVRLGWTALAALTLGGIFPDLFTNGVNVFYPLYDGFYSINGRLHLSNQRGVVQTFVELAPEEPRATTETRHYRTGVDPSSGEEPENVERVFPVVSSGTQLLLVLTSVVVVGARLRENGRRRRHE
ncbi:metal-dependent hydrolase [Haloprofundus halobius]|uniref:metal-dependent hydrolase n=1 Tax=Haloprofundus halobius TaxID=2876194 RepID=UPI001CC99845|nr:metal-dependent hydrolase [Haloprofundus halobius]